MFDPLTGQYKQQMMAMQLDPATGNYVPATQAVTAPAKPLTARELEKQRAAQEKAAKEAAKAEKERKAEERRQRADELREERAARRARMGTATLNVQEAEKSGKLVAEMRGVGFTWPLLSKTKLIAYLPFSKRRRKPYFPFSPLRRISSSSST